MPPRLPIDNRVYRAFTDAILVREVSLCRAWLGAVDAPDFSNLCGGKDGVASLTAPRYVFRV